MFIITNEHKRAPQYNGNQPYEVLKKILNLSIN